MYSDYGTYGLVLATHSILRWLVLAVGLAGTGRTWFVRLTGRSWSTADTWLGRLFVIGLDLQLLLGVVLYGFFSPVVAGALMRPDLAMRSRGMRFWLLEHPLAMLVALALAHVGLAKAKRAAGADAPRQASLYFTLAVLIVLAAIPWPIFSYGRLLWPSR